ncbi:hypothetical protein J6590_014578 [Homalodisca vitripennis]|nr:hypothetical protein J6590_014578 [Homalodisca vitripennis]
MELPTVPSPKCGVDSPLNLSVSALSPPGGHVPAVAAPAVRDALPPPPRKKKRVVGKEAEGGSGAGLLKTVVVTLTTPISTTTITINNVNINNNTINQDKQVLDDLAIVLKYVAPLLEAFVTSSPSFVTGLRNSVSNLGSVIGIKKSFLIVASVSIVYQSVRGVIAISDKVGRPWLCYQSREGTPDSVTDKGRQFWSSENTSTSHSLSERLARSPFLFLPPREDTGPDWSFVVLSVKDYSALSRSMRPVRSADEDLPPWNRCTDRIFWEHGRGSDSKLVLPL